MDSTKELIKELEMNENPETRIHTSANSQNYDINNINLENIDTETNINIINSNSINVQKSDAGIPVLENSQKSKTRIRVLENSNDSETKFIQSNKGGQDINNRATWIHPDLAIQLAQWISPKFALQVSKWIRTLFISGSVSLENELKLKDKRIQLLQDSFIKKQKRINYPEKNVIYIVTTEDNKNKRIYIIGKATNLKQRLSGYNKTSEHEVIFYKSCDTEENMNLVE